MSKPTECPVSILLGNSDQIIRKCDGRNITTIYKRVLGLQCVNLRLDVGNLRASMAI